MLNWIAAKLQGIPHAIHAVPRGPGLCPLARAEAGR
jgi:hypothetical protein